MFDSGEFGPVGGIAGAAQAVFGLPLVGKIFGGEIEGALAIVAVNGIDGGQAGPGFISGFDVDRAKQIRLQGFLAD